MRNYITKREQQVLDHLLDGDNAEEIAKKLKLTYKTIKMYMTNIYRVHGVSGGSARAKLMAKLLEKT
jgi:DNA-binding NarL/FixJ family response regulator